jgi:GntR family transcriptional regulator, transcriptional repressor for pyruvate dehydrogenase complex
MKASRSLRRTKTSVIIAEAIVEDIFQRRILPGTVLATEAQLMVTYGAGRATIREALRLLEAQGVLSIRPGPAGGAVVQRPALGHIAQLLSVLLSLNSGSLHEVIDARLVLEPALASRAAANATETQCQALRDSVRRQVEVIDTEPQFLEENDFFHALLSEAAGNRALYAFQAALSRIAVGQQVGVRYDRAARDATVESHRRITDAVCKHQEVRAALYMTKHMQALEAYLVANYAELLGDKLRIFWGALPG